MVGFELGSTVVGAYDLPHCTGLGDLTKGLGGLLATMWQLSDLTLYSVNKVRIIFASLCPLEEQMNCQMIKTYEEFPCYLEQGLANFIKDWIVNILFFVSHRVSVIVTAGSKKAIIDNI